MDARLWEAYEIAAREVIRYPDGSPQQKDAEARCRHLADLLAKERP